MYNLLSLPVRWGNAGLDEIGCKENDNPVERPAIVDFFCQPCQPLLWSGDASLFAVALGRLWYLFPSRPSNTGVRLTDLAFYVIPSP